MLSAHIHCKYLLPFILILLIQSSHGKLSMPEFGDSTHRNFFRSTFRGRLRLRQRQGFVSCGDDPNTCGESTCCFEKLCIDTLRDSNNCGACGVRCGFGLVCCEGKCVDIRNDSGHCGSCFRQCPHHGGCSFAMCDYGG